LAGSTGRQGCDGGYGPTLRSDREKLRAGYLEARGAAESNAHRSGGW
jgi:hypothetical protein